MISKERAKQIFDMSENVGNDETAKAMGITKESVRRARRMFKESGKTIETTPNDEYETFCKRFSPEERKAIINGRSLRTEQESIPRINFDSKEVTIAFCTDTHIGAKHFLQHYWESFLDECNKQSVDMILHGGDLIEGMSNRPDQVYSLSHVGYSAQMDYATQLLDMTDIPIKIIDGNHDRWGIKSGGLYAVKEVASRLSHVEFLGHDSGSIWINGTEWMLHHGEDGGGSYATSYRLQKIIEAFKGGQKPAVLLTGHDHKQCYIFTRNVHGVAGGALCTQSQWMKSTRKENLDGFWILRAGIADDEVKWFEPRWYPFY